jgi:hypothetical protein
MLPKQDIQTIRGTQMLDIGVGKNNNALLFLRRVITTTERASAVVAEMMTDTKQIGAELQNSRLTKTK